MGVRGVIDLLEASSDGACSRITPLSLMPYTIDKTRHWCNAQGNKKPLALVTPAANNKRTELGLTGLTLRQLQPFDLINCPGLESG